MEALSDDLMSDGDLASALGRIARHGFATQGEQRVQGTQALLRQTRAQRQEELERYDLDSMVQDIKERISDILATERAGIDQRRQEIEGGDGSATESDRRAFAAIADRRMETLESFPEEPGSAVTSLADYEFLSDFARAKFDGLMDLLQRQVLQTHFKTMHQSMQALTSGDIESLTEALKALNDLVERADAVPPSDFERFRQAHGSHFPRTNSLDDLLVQLVEQAWQTESLLSSMSPELRRTLEDSMGSALRNPRLRDEMARLNVSLESLAAQQLPVPRYPFSGRESLTFDEALRLMRRMNQLDDLEQVLRAEYESAGVPALDPAHVRNLLGEQAYDSLRALQSLVPVLEEAGYLRRDGDALSLTARGIRRIGQKALQDIFRGVRRSSFGEHAMMAGGAGSDASDHSKAYEFGDPFLLDLSRTLMNAIGRGDATDRLRLTRSDFEVYRTEHASRAATVLMVDMSRSMPMRGCFAAAKKVALALHTLIRGQFPRDFLYVVGFSDYARQLHAETLYGLSMNEFVHGTNIQHGLLLARRLLAGHKNGSRQIILITDGEPTAHFEDNRIHFSYPPSPQTVQATLREVQRCTRDDIVINTFMLERSHYLADFVNQMTRINRGRVFFATPERLGDYVLVDYVEGRRKAL
jgi:uncharacterized protein with von Willebrand factor type A (vWA) domain